MHGIRSGPRGKILSITLAFWLTHICVARIIYVNDDAAGANTGLNWADAFRELQSALAAAQAGDEVWVAEGIYPPDFDVVTVIHTSDRMMRFRLINGVQWLGGFSGTETTVVDRAGLVENTILSGDIGVPYDMADNSFHVVSGNDIDHSAVIDGFTITAGAGTDETFNAGGGIFNNHGSPTISNCRVMGNTAIYGGGISNYNGSNPKIERSLIASNTAQFYGGGIYNFESSPSITGTVFQSNHGTSGGGVYDEPGSLTSLSDCEFLNNFADSYGGALFGGEWNPPIAPEFRRCTFDGNTAVYGGAIYYSPYSFLHITDCRFINNRGSGSGGALFVEQGLVTVAKSSFAENSAGEGGAVFLDLSVRSSSFSSCTFIANGADRYGGAASVSAGQSSFSDCLLESNIAGYSGGAVWLRALQPASFSACTLRGNIASGGGGIAGQSGPLEIRDCLFDFNTAGPGHGGAVYERGGPLTISSSEFLSNIAGYGGAVSSKLGTLLEARNVSFGRNRANYAGGAIYMEGGRILNCFFHANSVNGSGGGLFNYANSNRITNSVFVGNRAGAGGAMAGDFYSGSAVSCCTFTANRANTSGGAIDAFSVPSSPFRFSNCNLWQNSAPAGAQIHEFQRNPPVPPAILGSFSNVQGGWPGKGNIAGDPMFVRAPSDGGDGWGDNVATLYVDESLNDDFGDLRLLPGSPLIDAGDDNAVPADSGDLDSDDDLAEPTPLDLASQARFVDDPATRDSGKASPLVLNAIVDVGAFEFIPGDYDGDGSATLSDFQLLNACMAVEHPMSLTCRVIDANNDGRIDLYDFSIFQLSYRP